MATISRRALSEYRKALDLTCRRAGASTRRALEQWLRSHPNATVEELRKASIAIAEALLGSYGDAASALGCSMFDTVMELEGVRTGAAQPYGGVRAEAVDGYTRRVVGGVDGSQGAFDAFVDAMGQLAERETRLAANAAVEGNVERASRTQSGRYVRFARVPTSAVPCAWCAMLASRGFDYRSMESASAASHHHCTCTIVPGVKGSTVVAGYDTDHYKDVWEHRDKYVQEQGE